MANNPSKYVRSREFRKVFNLIPLSKCSESCLWWLLIGSRFPCKFYDPVSDPVWVPLCPMFFLYCPIL